MNLRPYQQKGVADIRNAYRDGYRAPLFVLPTGGGKTVVFAHIAATSAQKGKRVLILVHRIELIRQTAAKLRESGVRVGLINPMFSPDPSAPVQVASVQTMVKRSHLYRTFDLIITDEAHHIVSSTYRTILDFYPDAFQLGVTATPIRGDGRGLGKIDGGVFDSLILGPSVSDLIGQGHLVRPVIYAPRERLDFSDVRTRMGDYDKAEIERRVDKPKITGDAVLHYRDLCSGAPSVWFCISVAHAQHVAEQFKAAGYRAVAVDGKMDDITRGRALNGLATGEVEVVTSCDLISEGTDIPAIACAGLLRPTQSLGLYLQQVGRALRPSKGKDRAIILDHVGNVLIHGLPEETRAWSLEGEMKARRSKKEKAEQPINVHQCENCYAVFEASLLICPECGHVRVAKGREIGKQDGQLVELTDYHKLQLKREKKQEIGRAKTLEDLEKIAEARGYKKQWAKHVFESRNK